MRLTSYSDYGFRILLHLGSHAGELVPVAAIAKAYRISLHHLQKVAQTLTRAGFVRSQRGPSGGLALARPPEEIRLGDVLRATEPDFDLVECFDATRNQCGLTGACRLQELMGQAQRAFLAAFDAHTLADLLRSRTTLVRLRRLP